MAQLLSTDISVTDQATIAKGTTAQATTGQNGNTQSGALRFNTDYNEINYFVNQTAYNAMPPSAVSLPGYNRPYGAISRGDYPGASSGNAATSAQEIKKYYPAAPDGVYWINLPSVGATQIYCLMNPIYAGGGWMMAMKATRGSTFGYGSSYWTSVNTLNPAQNNRNDGDAKFETFNRFPAKDLYAIFPDVSGNTGASSGIGVWSWFQQNFYNGQRQGPTYGGGVYSPGTGGALRGGHRIELVNLFNRVNRYFIQDADNFHGGPAYGVFSSQVDIRFYGFNWTDNYSSRWGFGYNENGGGLFPNGATGSDDINCGIGLSNGYSAGDAIYCCTNRNGINRTMRVEIYVR